MDEKERQEYLKAYYENETNANEKLSYANAFSALLMVIIFIMYLTGIFPLQSDTFLIVMIVFPVSIIILLTPLIYTLFGKKYLKKPGYKYYVVFSLVLVIAVVNVILPKHGIVGWGLAIVIVNHYYNPKLGMINFVVVLFMMFFALYAAMFLGEYDPNLLGKGFIDTETQEIIWPNGVYDRYKMLHDMLLDGENRYVKVFLFYYLPRAGFLSLIFYVSNALNRRTYKLLVDEITVSSKQEKTRTELEVAKEIQLATLPSFLLSNEDIEIQAELKAAKEVGGDFYDYFVLDNDHVAILIGDVSGKGIPAAMFMMKTITCFKNIISLEKTPSEILTKVNATLNEGNDSKMFVTCFLAIINTKTGECIFSNAGHNPPLIGQNRRYTFLPCNHGFLLGAMPKVFLKDEYLQLKNGDTITLYTDGITEARDKKGHFYGDRRLLELYNKKHYSCLLELHHQLKDDVFEFMNGAPQSDDMTYITLKFHGNEYIAEEKSFDGTQDNINNVLAFFKKFSDEQNIDKAFTNNLLVVADELISNIVKYGYSEKEGTIFIRLLYDLVDKELVITIIDTGAEFNPFEVNSKPISGDAKNVKEGGLGILIVKTLMSEYAYDRINGKNIVVLKKKF